MPEDDTTSIAAKTLADPYILTMILRLLPMQDVFRAIRVCTAWKEAVDTSSKLQQKLFFKASASEIRVLVKEKQLLSSCIAAVAHPPETLDDTALMTVRAPHPLLTDQADFTWEECSFPPETEKISFSTFFANGQGASFTKAFVSQPPVKKMNVTPLGWAGFEMPDQITVSNENGVTFADIATAVQAIRCTNKQRRTLGDDLIFSFFDTLLLNYEFTEGQLCECCKMPCYTNRFWF